MGERARRGAKPYARWSADTERAFLLALKLSGQVTKAAAEIGRGISAAYKRRERHPAFAAAWDKAVAEGQAEWAALSAERHGALDDGAGGGRLVRGREREDGWDAERRAAFLRVLRQTKQVALASRAAGISARSAYALRRRSEPFAEAWAKALAAYVPTVRDAALERAVTGWIEPIVAGGKVVGERWRYSDSLLRVLLRHELAMAEAAAAAAKDPAALVKRAKEAASAAGGGFYPRATEEETNRALMKKLDALDRQRARAAEDAEREGRPGQELLPAPPGPPGRAG